MLLPHREFVPNSALDVDGDIFTDTIVIGAAADDSARGSAYVFVRSGGRWSQRQKLAANDGRTNDEFGFSVAINGETTVIGAKGTDIRNPDQGAAYIFLRSGASWGLQQRLIASDGGRDSNFGNAVAIDGETVVVGASSADIGGNFDQGAAYLFARSGNSWSRQAKLTAGDGLINDRFSSSIAISGNAIVIGALQHFGSRGAAYALSPPANNAPPPPNTPPAINAIPAQRPAGSRPLVLPIAQVSDAEDFENLLQVNAGDGCAWTAVSNNPVIIITSGANGSGNGTIRFAVSKNPNPGSRRGALTIAGRKVTVVQAAPIACVSAASFAQGALATESIVAAFGSGLALPRSLAGRGEVDLSVIVDGKQANMLKVAVK